MPRTSVARKLDRNPSPALGSVDRRVERSLDVPVRDDPTGKRLLDLLLASLMLVFTAPAWALIALAIKLEDGDPVLYEQERYGRGGGRFHLKKFRSMRAGCDRDHGIRQAKEDDPRVTRVGRLLRRFGLDELPQILAIWKGDMSFVGPRPLAIGEIIEDEEGNHVPWESLDGFADRLSLRPGLTSLATVYLPKDVHPERKFRYDLEYVRRRSLALDLRLILVSFLISFSGRWETQGKE